MNNNKILNHYGWQHQFFIKMREELKERLETINEIEKDGWTLENIEHFLEERADVENLDDQIVIYLIKNKLYLNPLAFIYCMKHKKQEKQISRINNNDCIGG